MRCARAAKQVKIKLQVVINAITQAADAYTTFYDTKTKGTVYLPDVWVTGETDEALAAMLWEEPERFSQFPAKYDIYEYSIIDSFVDYLPSKKIKSKLSGVILRKGAFRRFK